MHAPRTTGNLASACPQSCPLVVSIERDPALVNDIQQQQRRSVLYAIQPRQVHLAAYRTLETDGELDRRVSTVLSERHQQIQVGVRHVVPSRKGAIDDRETDIGLGSKRTSQGRQQRPVSRCVTSLVLAYALTAWPDTLAANRPVRGGATQRARIDTQLISELHEFQHIVSIGLRMTVIALDDRRRLAVEAARERRLPLTHRARVASSRARELERHGMRVIGRAHIAPVEHVLAQL